MTTKIDTGQLRLGMLWLGLAAALHFAWELVQLPLYTIFHEAAAITIAYAVAHCTAGDVLIAAVTYAVAAMATRSWRWPFERPVAGAAVLITSGVGYTVFSEWQNVYVRQSWAYTEAMPRLWGIGIAPLLQWLVVPLAALAMLRAVDPSQIPS